MSAAVEAFWTQNKIIIESPLTSSSTSTSALKTKFTSQFTGPNAAATNSAGGTKTSSSGLLYNNNKKATSVHSPLSLESKGNTGIGYKDNRSQLLNGSSGKMDKTSSRKRDQG
jgi:hypothetical protein